MTTSTKLSAAKGLARNASAPVFSAKLCPSGDADIMITGMERLFDELLRATEPVFEELEDPERPRAEPCLLPQLRGGQAGRGERVAQLVGEEAQVLFLQLSCPEVP